MALQNALFDPMLDAAAQTAVAASLHTADPGADGSAEVAGGAYGRQSVAWDPASGGELSAAADLVFTVPGGNTVSWLGLWSNDDTWLGGIPLSTPESYGAEGTYTVSALRLTQTDTTPAP